MPFLSPRLAHTLVALTAALAFAAPSQAFVTPDRYTVTAVQLPANDVIYNPVSHEYLVSVASTAGVGLGNTITRLSTSGQILGSTYVGSEPGVLALSTDGSTGYVGMQGSSFVRKFDGFTGAAGMQFSLPPMWMGPTRANDLEVMPGDNDTVAVAVRNTCCSPKEEGVSIYRNGDLVASMRSYETSVIEFGANASTIYAYDNGSSGFTFQTLTLDNTGLHLTSSRSGVMFGYGESFQYQDGLVYSTRGVVADPTLGVQLGTLPSGPGFVVDAKQGLSFAMNENGMLVLGDLNTFVPVASYDLSSKVRTSYTMSLVAGDAGALALRSAGALYLLTPVPEASTASLMLLGLCGMVAFARQNKAKQNA